MMYSSRDHNQSIMTELKNRRCIIGCIFCKPLTVTVNAIAECLRTDCNILGDNKNRSIKNDVDCF